MKKLIRKSWINWDKITAEWFSFIGWIILLGGLIVLTIYEVFYVKNNNPGFIYLKFAFVVIATVSSILLIVYIFKKCYILSRKLLPPGKSKALWLLMLIEAISLCALLTGFVGMIALTFKTVPGI
jgi:hypothetical protein